MAEGVYDLLLDEGNLAEMKRHLVRELELRQLLANQPVLLRNRTGHRATHILIGRTHSGRFLTVPVEQINAEEGLWRPATAWASSDNEIVRYYRAGGS